MIKISVRNLVEFILCSGDIDNRRGGIAEKEAMAAGSRIHRKIQKQMGSEYHAEAALKLKVELANAVILLEGRADGIIIPEVIPIGEERIVTIDEIKGIYKELQFLREPVTEHLAQAKCYAYIYAKHHEEGSMRVQMTYCNLDTEEKKYFVYDYTFQELEDWFFEVMSEYEKWADFQIEWRKIRQDSVKEIEFPFEYREGQRNLAVSVYRTIQRKKRLFIQAPTGIGKTISTVFPAVKAVGEEFGEKIFYLTAKTITRTVAMEAFEVLKQKGLKYKVIILTAKEKLCASEEMECNPDACPYAKGHYDRVNDAVFELITGKDSLTREVIYEHAIAHQVCPFEMGLDASLWCDAVICDYNYVFDPNVYLKRFFSDGINGEYLFLIDEAHNLVERGREMYSAQLYKEDFLELKKSVKYYSRKLEQELERCNRNLLELKRECETYQIYENAGSFSLNLLRLNAEMEKFMEIVDDADIRKKVSDFYLEVRHFLNMNELLDENYVVYTELEEGRFKIKLFCVNPSVNLRKCMDKGNSTIFFSATLLPIQYYKELLSGEAEDYAIYAHSPFQTENRLLLIAQDVSSKYTRRNKREFEKIASYIYKTQKKRAGNYLIFFPSYAFLEQVYEAFFELYQVEGISCLRQSANMGEYEREEFLELFADTENKNTLLGFCVMGGIFGEGIDLKEEQLIGALIVGTGLPGVCNEREILKRYYDEKGMQGFDYSYRFPGMNKVLQSAGRVIRTAQDTGVIILLDERFQYMENKQLFPKEWEKHTACNIHTLDHYLETFWNQK